MQNKLTIKRGDAFKGTSIIPITIKDADGQGVDITNATVFFTVRDTETSTAANDDVVVLKKDITSHTTPASGLTALTLEATDTDITP